MTTRSTAVFVPAHNEAGNLHYVVGEAVGFFHNGDFLYEGDPFHVIIVNDGSTDGTAEVAEELATLYPEVSIVTHEVNKGYGAVLRDGFKAALDTDAEWIGFCDGDGQFEPHNFGRLIEFAEHHEADVCVGFRIKRADGVLRLVTGRMWHFISQYIFDHFSPKELVAETGFRPTDVDCGMRVFRRAAMARIYPNLKGEYATINPEIIREANQANLKIVECGVAHFKRRSGEQSGLKLHVIKGSFSSLFEIARTRKEAA